MVLKENDILPGKLIFHIASIGDKINPFLYQRTYVMKFRNIKWYLLLNFCFPYIC